MSADTRHGVVSRSALMALCMVAVSCAYLQPRETVPYTGRQRLRLLYTEKEMAVLGAEAHGDISKRYELVSAGNDVERVLRVGRRIARATDEDYDWEFRLYRDDDVINAFCLPGGKIGVFTGMLPITRSDDDVTVVLSHEIAYAILQHSNERMSQPLVKKLVGMPTSIAVGVWGAISRATRKVVMSGLGAGHVVGELLPYSQQHEIEADEVGLIFMQKAGYDLDAAPRLWLRLEAESKGRISDSVSTHPGSRERAANLQRKIQQMQAGRQEQSLGRSGVVAVAGEIRGKGEEEA